ncbi:MAG: zinc ribbon domain-containing protein [Anaerolineae bacterium]
MSSPASRSPNGGSFDCENFVHDSRGDSTAGVDCPPTCPQCRSLNREGSQFCGHCGAALVRYGPQCGVKIPTSAYLCEGCSIESKAVAISQGRCQRCGSQAEEHAESCGECGARLLARCPQCGTMARATNNYCPYCRFAYSRFVTEKLVRKHGRGEEEGNEPPYVATLNSAIMVALTILSILLIVYILAQT